MSTVSPLVIRADASAAIGTGHVMRSIALAQAWADLGGRVLFVSHDLPSFLRERLQLEKYELADLSESPGCDEDARGTALIASKVSAAAIVVDGYQFGSDYRRSLQRAGLRVVAIDDFGGVCDSDLVVNSNAYGSLADYSGGIQGIEQCPLILAGPQFAMLRREFREAMRPESVIAILKDAIKNPVKAVARPNPTALHTLLSFGGSDPKNATEKVLRLLAETGNTELQVTALVGGSFQRLAELHLLIRELPFPVSVVQNCTDMPSLIRSMDLAITAGGSTCWELACLGLPMIAIITADNQQRVAGAIESFGIGWNAGTIETLSADVLKSILEGLRGDPLKRFQMSGLGSSLIDGYGACRIAEALQSPEVFLSLATLEDSRLLWEWRNEESVRLASFSTDPIPWEDHCRWFSSRLESAQSRILVARNGQGIPVGQVRLDLKDHRATISISIAEKFRSSGYGRTLIRKATVLAICYFEATAVDAFIRPENLASQRAFQKAGYQMMTATDGESTQASSGGLHFVFGSRVGSPMRISKSGESVEQEFMT